MQRTFEVEAVREQFPALGRTHNGHRTRVRPGRRARLLGGGAFVVECAVGLVSPTLYSGGGRHERTNARACLGRTGLSTGSGNLSRRDVLHATAAYREVYERLQQNAGENGAE